MSGVTSMDGVWIDEMHAVIRRGIVSTLIADHIPVSGESAALVPSPRFPGTSVLLFNADGTGFGKVVNLIANHPIRLIATIRTPTGARLRELADIGVSGILLLDELTPELLLHSVRSASQGRTTLTHGLLMRLLEHAEQQAQHSSGGLTGRERQVLELLAQGDDTRSIAFAMNYSERTVKNVVHDLLTKLNCRTRAQAVALAAKSGVI